MDSHGRRFNDIQNDTRRAFVMAGARFVTGSSIAAAVMRAGSIGREASAAGETANHVLRAARFPAAGGGNRRKVWGYDGQSPGPLIRAREGETIRIRVVNELDVPTSIHWHGIHQHGSWTMDGVEEISRPPIAAGSEFTYEFRAEPAGTHWYHSHVGVQYGNGLIGPLIVEERQPLAGYDREDVLLINDCFNEIGDAILAKLRKGTRMSGDKMPAMKQMADKAKMPGMKHTAGGQAMRDLADVPYESALINGKGRFPGSDKTAFAEVVVKPGERLRLRLINGSSTFTFRFQVDDHPLTVIATDGSPTRPVQVDNLVLAPGERYDVILEAVRRGVHWIHAAAVGGGEVLAVLRYAGVSSQAPVTTPVRWGSRALEASMLRSPQPVKLTTQATEIPIVLGGSMMPYRWSINGQFYPKADPIVFQKDQSIRFLFRNTTGMDHPFHLHGHSFWVIGKPGGYNLVDPVEKDTINVPAGSELAVQWVADNPGRWFFHCHIEWHLMTGMARVLEVQPHT
jgi:FtsP/CotA-like multicopper oxidase with cupredoxin domain